MTRLSLGIIWLIATSYAWLASASYVALYGLDRLAGFQAPWLQWIPLARQPNHTRYEMLWLYAGAALPTATVGLCLILTFQAWLRRRQKHLIPPKDDSARPIVRGPSDNYGHAHILTDEECLRRFPGPSGIVIGELRSGPPGRTKLAIDPILSDAGNGVMVAGVGSGKSTSLATMLMHWPSSALVLDPKIELAEMLRDALEADGKTVHVVNPKIAGSGFNAIGWFDPNKPLASLDIKSIITWLFPDEDDPNTTKDPYFEPTGKSLCAAILADLLWSDRPAHEKTLEVFRAILVTPEDKMKKVMQHIAAFSKSPLARDLASTLKGITPKQWSGIYGTATLGTEWLSSPDLAKIVSGDAFDVRSILDGNTVVFAQIPLKTLMQAPGVGRVIIGSMMNAVYEADGQRSGRIGFFLDEAWSLGRMQIQKAALVTGRSFGVTMIWFYQSLGQIKEVWGDNGISTLYNSLTWRAYAAVKDPKLAEEISADFGEISVLAWSEGDNTGTQRPAGMGFGSRSKGSTTNVSEVKRRRVLRQEVMSADPSDLFVLSGRDTMILRTPKAHLRPEFDGIVKPSPHYAAAPGTGAAPAMDLVTL